LGHGINQGLRRDTLHSLHRRVAELIAASGRRVSLIGWYAVALARVHCGTWSTSVARPVRWVFEELSGAAVTTPKCRSEALD
jgi:hypothetical protein